MHETLANQHEAVAQYSARQMIEMTRTAHQTAWQILEEISATLKPGITEAEAREAAQVIYVQHGVEKSWHRPHIYFGSHTLLSAYDPKPSEILTLGENDIAYIDIGPIISVDGVDIEGDVGQTLVFGDNPMFHQLKAATETIFTQAREYWLSEQPTGIALYQHIAHRSEAAGFTFNLEPAGHLIGAFPHLGWKNGLNHYPHTPEPGIWILEIQLRHLTEPYGAFYEAVLV